MDAVYPDTFSRLKSVIAKLLFLDFVLVLVIGIGLAGAPYFSGRYRGVDMSRQMNIFNLIFMIVLLFNHKLCLKQSPIA